MISNKTDVPLVAALWAVTDNYDHVDEPNYISATTLLKPTQEIILQSRLGQGDRPSLDVVDLIPSAMGNSLHSSIESAWVNNYKQGLKKLGYTDDVIDSILINPPRDRNYPNSIPIYLEQRSFRTIEGFCVGGKFDIVIEGRLHDYKSTSVYSWIYGTNNENYKLQGSIYRWLNPELITSDILTIVYIFTDWSKSGARSNVKYPQRRVESIEIPLYSLEETETYISNKLKQIKLQMHLPDHKLSPCTSQELWLKNPTYKYYSDPKKISGRSTKNFDSEQEANNYVLAKGKGIVIKSDPLPTRCNYCVVSNICAQKQNLFASLDWEEPNDLL